MYNIWIEPKWNVNALSLTFLFISLLSRFLLILSYKCYSFLLSSLFRTYFESIFICMIAKSIFNLLFPRYSLYNIRLSLLSKKLFLDTPCLKFFKVNIPLAPINFVISKFLKLSSKAFPILDLLSSYPESFLGAPHFKNDIHINFCDTFLSQNKTHISHSY